jgi:hypothetical protein
MAQLFLQRNNCAALCTAGSVPAIPGLASLHSVGGLVSNIMDGQINILYISISFAQAVAPRWLKAVGDWYNFKGLSLGAR